MKWQPLETGRYHDEEGITWNTSDSDFERIRGNNSDGLVSDIEDVTNKAHLLIFLRLLVGLLLIEEGFQRTQGVVLHGCPVKEGFHTSNSSSLRIERRSLSVPSTVSRSRGRQI